MISERIQSGLHEVENLWSFQDVVDAHDVLDLIEKDERRNMEQAKSKKGHR